MDNSAVAGESPGGGEDSLISHAHRGHLRLGLELRALQPYRARKPIRAGIAQSPIPCRAVKARAAWSNSSSVQIWTRPSRLYEPLLRHGPRQLEKRR